MAVNGGPSKRCEYQMIAANTITNRLSFLHDDPNGLRWPSAARGFIARPREGWGRSGSSHDSQCLVVEPFDAGHHRLLWMT